MPEEFAPGLPDPRRFGRPTQLPVGTPLRYVIQKHLAERAGPHYDIRLGPDRGAKPTLLSWAARHLPEPGEKRLAVQQPLHTGQYADFEGKITRGYGKGTVTTHDKGSVLVTKVTPEKINFVVIHKKIPETYTLVRQSRKAPVTAREKRVRGNDWLLINTTPRQVIPHRKIKYSKVPAEDVQKLFNEDYLHSEKIDGAAALYKVLSDRIEVLSYRASKEGRPIVHTYRVGGTTGINIPKELVGTVMRGELWGERKRTGEAIPPQELGGLLNATVLKSLQKQRAQDVNLRNALFDIYQIGSKKVDPDAPIEERMELLQRVLKHLPAGKFHLPRTAIDPETQREMWEDIKAGRNPRTREGVVVHPRGGGKPTKVKLTEEHDVYVRDIFPGRGRLAGVGAGGFRYSYSPTGAVAGEVGTGLSEELRREMLADPESFIGRIAKVRAQEKFPSGALRAPSLLSLHEDYPAAKGASVETMAKPATTDYHVKMAMPAPPISAIDEFARYRQALAGQAAPTTVGGAAGQLGMGAVFGPALGTAGAALRAPFVGRQRALQALKGAWRPASMARGASMMVGPGAALFGGGLEAAGLFGAATSDPRYQAGQIGLGEALKGQLGSMGQAAQHRAQQAFSGGLLGKARGAVTSPFQGIFNPMSTVTGFGQAAKRLLLGKNAAEEGPLTRLVKQASKELGNEGDTLADFAKAAGYLDDPLRPWLADLSPGKDTGGTSIRDRLISWLMGVDPGDIQNVRSGIRGASKAIGTVKRWTGYEPPERKDLLAEPAFDPLKAVE